MKIGRITISDRAHAGVYADRSGPEVERRLRDVFGEGSEFMAAIIADEIDAIAERLRWFADEAGCDLIVTVGGTGIGPRDITPEATRLVLDKELPGFGELMRVKSYAKVRTSILSRAIWLRPMSARVKSKKLISSSREATMAGISKREHLDLIPKTVLSMMVSMVYRKT